MQQKLMLQPRIAQRTASRFAFNVADIDGLFPGFKIGDFAVIYGPQSVTSLISQLCIQATLEVTEGGLESKVVFIDAASSSSIPSIIEAAEFQSEGQKNVFGNIIHLRAYTAYKLTSLIMEKLEEAVKDSGAKLVVISDIAGPFLNGNVDDQEAKAVFGSIMSYLAGFAKKHQIILVATYLAHEESHRNSTLQEISRLKANTVLRFTKTPYTSEVELEKHPSYMLGVAEFTPQIKRLTDYRSKNDLVPALRYRIM